MSKGRDWWPGNRHGKLVMVRKWMEVCTLNAEAWKIEEDVLKELSALADEADNSLKLVQHESTRTPVAHADCKEAFELLTAAARDMKRRYFLVPPLRKSDLIALGLKVPDPNPTPSGPPTARAKIDTFLEGRYELGYKVAYCSGNPDDPANKGFRIFYLVQDKSEGVPLHQTDLHESFFTKRKKDILRFAPEDSGKMCHMAVQIENEGKKGPWGPITSALIP